MAKTYRTTDAAAMYAACPARYPELHGKTALVTGSSRGIGQAIAIRLAKEGMQVVITARTDETVRQTVEALRACGAEASGIAADLTTLEGVEAVLAHTRQTFGAPEVLVNNAANLMRKPLFEVTDELLQSELASNISAPFRLSVRMAQLLRDAGKGGCIINISSIGSQQSHHPGLPYDMTKAALNSMTMSMALDLAPFGIRVNTIAPGAIRTYEIGVDETAQAGWQAFQQRIPLARAGEPLEIAAAAAFLASDDASYITGALLNVDGGVMAQISPRGYPI